MKKVYDGRLNQYARSMRRDMTKAEHLLWQFLRKRPERFYRQRVIGPFVADFYSSRVKLAIEADGAQHSTEEGKAYDLEREAFFAERGIRTIRFTNREITEDFFNVRAQIEEAILKRSGEV